MSNFSDILDAVAAARCELEFPASWRQGRATYGGLVASAALRALRHALPAPRPLRSLMVAFVAPVGDGPAHIDAQVVRAGRTATHARAEIAQAGEICCSVTAYFGEEMPSSLHIAAPPRPEVASADSFPEIPYRESAPVFTRQVEYRWSAGSAPFGGGTDTRVEGWCRFRGAQRASGEELAVALLDAWPPPILPLLARPAPSSTATWWLHCSPGLPARCEQEWWFFAARARTAAHGHAVSEATLWSPDGTAAVFSAQTLTVFDGRSGSA